MTVGKVLLTGATGLVGRALLEQVDGPEVLALTRNGPPAWARDLPNLAWINADLANPGFERELPSEIDAVIHLAQSPRYRDFPEGAQEVYDVNVGSTARLLEHARRCGAQRFVLASTATVYQRSAEPLTEDAPLDCSSFYAASKRSAELLLSAYAGMLSVISLRLFTVYGADQRNRLIANLIERVRSGQAVELEGTQGLLLSPIHVGDAAAAFLDSLRMPLERGGPRVVNVAGSEVLGIREIAEAIGAEIGRKPHFEERGSAEPGGFIADRSRAIELLRVPEPIPFAEGLRRTL